MKLIPYFNLSRHSSPFSHEPLYDRLADHGFRKVEKINLADLIIVRSRQHAVRVGWLFPDKIIVVWTDEPRADNTTGSWSPSFLQQNILVFNVFCGNVFRHNFHFLGSYHFREDLDIGIPRNTLCVATRVPGKIAFESRKLAAAFFTRKSTAESHCIINGKDVDLQRIRQSLAVAGHQLKCCDIFGRNWDEMATGASGFDTIASNDWWTIKINQLANYRFNLALENTLYPQYVTEKIWQPLLSGCLPVYWGAASSIYESFPAESFVDASQFREPIDLWDYLREMSYAEFKDRFERCIFAYNTGIRYWESTNFNYFDSVISLLESELRRFIV